MNHNEIMTKNKTANRAAEILISHYFARDVSVNLRKQPSGGLRETSFSRDANIREMQLFMYVMNN